MQPRYTLKTLASASGVPWRTIKEWIRKKVLAPPLGGGRGSHYDDAHLTTARVIRHMRSSGLPLDAIGARIRGRSLSELKALLPADAPNITGARLAADKADGLASGFFSRMQTLQAVELTKGLTLVVDAERGEAREMAEEIFRRYAHGLREGGG
jgi:DNA-binding transcriptional MerR regulator